MKLNGKQSKKARALLKWNLYDLASRTRISNGRLDSYEKGLLHLQKGENDELLKVYKKAGIEFGENMEVTLVLMDRKIQDALQSTTSTTITLSSHELLALNNADMVPGAATPLTPNAVKSGFFSTFKPSGQPEHK